MEYSSYSSPIMLSYIYTNSENHTNNIFPIRTDTSPLKAYGQDGASLIGFQNCASVVTMPGQTLHL